MRFDYRSEHVLNLPASQVVCVRFRGAVSELKYL